MAETQATQKGDKVRVYELAKEMLVDSKVVLRILERLDVPAKNHMSTMDKETADKVVAVLTGKMKLDEPKAKKKLQPATDAQSPPRPGQGDTAGGYAAQPPVGQRGDSVLARVPKAADDAAKQAVADSGGSKGEGERPVPQEGQRRAGVTEPRVAGPASRPAPRPVTALGAAPPHPARPYPGRMPPPLPRPGMRPPGAYYPGQVGRPGQIPRPSAGPGAGLRPPAGPGGPFARVPGRPPAAVPGSRPAWQQGATVARARVPEGVPSAAPRSASYGPAGAPRPVSPVGAVRGGVSPQPGAAKPAGEVLERPATRPASQRPAAAPAATTRAEAKPIPEAKPRSGVIAPKRERVPSRERIGAVETPAEKPPKGTVAGPIPVKTHEAIAPSTVKPAREPAAGVGERPVQPGIVERAPSGPAVAPEEERASKAEVTPPVIPAVELEEKPEAKKPELLEEQIDEAETRRQLAEELRRAERQEKEIVLLKKPKPREAPRVSQVKKVDISGPVTVGAFASKLGVTAAEAIKRLMSLGVMATVNRQIDPDTAVVLGSEFGVEVEYKPQEQWWEKVLEEEKDDPASMVPRSPVVTVMGHVDHGKTSLLDAIRHTNVTAREAGGITQHIGAYVVEWKDKEIVFIDTPGHEAFTAMRARGAKVTDVAVLVVAADDGVMPQTVEAYNHAKAAGVPVIVAINKIDKPNANVDLVKRQLSEIGLIPEEWGGDTPVVLVSAKERRGLDDLLEMILLVAEVLDLKANPATRARGTVIEAKLEKGRGAVATVLVQKGTLKVGDAFVVGNTWGKVRALVDYKGKRIKKAGPSAPVEVLGCADLPEAGDILRVVGDEKAAKEVAQFKAQKAREQASVAVKRSGLEELMARAEEEKAVELNLILKGDVRGTLEAVKGALERLSSPEVKLNVIHEGVGAISESDVMLAAASGAMVIGFNVRPDVNAKQAAEAQRVEIRTYEIIYDAIKDIDAAMKGMLKPKITESILGRAEVRAVFRIPKVGAVAGCYVTDGKVLKSARVRVLRDSTVVHTGKITSLKRFKDDVKEVASGYECGIGIAGFNDIREGDVLEVFELEEVAPSGDSRAV